jgi:hypothetical protein
MITRCATPSNIAKFTIMRMQFVDMLPVILNTSRNYFPKQAIGLCHLEAVCFLCGTDFIY